MALFDPERKRVVLRVVYDGPGHAGKTTNLQRLASAFAAWRRSDLVAPATIGERTQYFDWLEVDGGLLRSYPVRAQLLTVPGQRELTLRRKFVIERADVVVFVADSQPDALAEARLFYAELCEQLDGFAAPVPIVLQANKQDLPGALPPAIVARQISEGLRAPDQIKGCVASSNDGVKQTLAVALRLGTEAVRQQWGTRDPKTMAGDAGAIGDADSTFAALTHHEAERARGRSRVPEPTLPYPELPSTQLWPPVSARALLHELHGRPARRVATPDQPHRCVFELAGWKLTSGSDRFFASVEAAQAAMLSLTRRKVELGAWLPEPTVVAVVADPGGAGAWLWTVEPTLPTLAAVLADRDPDRRRDALSTYAEVLVGAQALAERHGLCVDLDTTAFGLQTGDRVRTRYLGERLDAHADADTPSAEWTAAIVAATERFAGEPAAVAEFTEILCLGCHYTPVADGRRAALAAALDQAALDHPAASPTCAAARRVLLLPAHG